MKKIGYIVIVAAMVVYAIAAVFLDLHASERRCADALGREGIRAPDAEASSEAAAALD